MLRLGLLYVAVVALMFISVRRWYLALCGLVVLTVFTQHPSMPTKMFGVQGLNPWNAALIVIAFFWLTNRQQEPPGRSVPGAYKLLLALYLLVQLASTGVAAMDLSSLKGKATGQGLDWLVINGIVNPFKYVLVGLMFFDGARSRARAWQAVVAALGSGMIYGFLMFKSMGLRVFSISPEGARRLTDKLVGLFANDMAELLAFVIWGGLFLTLAWPRRWQRAAWLAGIAANLPPFVALKSRAGFLAFSAVAFVLGVIRYRIILVLFPVAVALAILIAPGIRERVMTGFGKEGTDLDEVSAGRLTNIWPPVWAQITQGPVVGWGRYAILRTECYWEVLSRERGVPTHPHCAYLEILIDSGFVGLGVCLAGVAGLARAGWRLMRARGDWLLRGVGTAGLIATVTLLASSVAGSSFYATQSKVPYLVIWGLMLRAPLQRELWLPRRPARPAAPRRGLAAPPQPVEAPA